MLHLLDIFFTVLHLLIIVFNLFGWIWPATRKAHLISILLTAASWFVLGVWFGWGYCPITDWQWQVKARLEERGIPGSFIEYYAEKIMGSDLDSQLVNIITLVTFLVAIIVSIYVNFLIKKKRG
jgi:hypothetical protein